MPKSIDETELSLKRIAVIKKSFKECQKTYESSPVLRDWCEDVIQLCTLARKAILLRKQIKKLVRINYE